MACKFSNKEKLTPYIMNEICKENTGMYSFRRQGYLQMPVITTECIWNRHCQIHGAENMGKLWETIND